MAVLEIDERIVAQLRELVASGEYPDGSSAIREGLRWIKTFVEPSEANHGLREARAEYDRNDLPEPDDLGGLSRIQIELNAEVVERIMAVLGSQTGQSDFADESAVVSRALYLLEERKKLVHLRKLLAEAEAEIERGEYTVWRPGMMAELLELGRQRARDGIAPNPDVI
jgi:Arc/MetJ-type ribon-helix-helix transcriptional regulator